MKRLLLILFLFSASALQLMAQESAAKRAIAAGDYNAAVKFYQTAIATVENAAAKASLNEALAKAQVCATLANRSTTNYNAGNFADAKKYYQALLSQNPADPFAQRMIQQCNIRIANAVRNVADNKLWREIKVVNTIAAYKKYIAQYPAGLHIQEAKDIIVENDLWLVADAKGTKEAYNNYLSTSKLKTRRAEALHDIALIDDKASWANALRIDTYTGYQQYLSAAKQNAQYKKQAQAKIALFDAMTYYSTQHYDLARKSFEITKKYFALNDAQSRAYSKCCEETDYESMMQLPLVTKGTAFLANYPGSPYIPKVKDALSRAYCDNRDYSSARNYAQNKETLQYIKEQEKKNKKAQRSDGQWAKKYTSNSNSTSSSYSSGTSASRYKSATDYSGMFQLGLGAEGDILSKIWSASLPVEFRIGRTDQLFNFVIGEQFTWRNGFGGGDEPTLSSTQFSTVAQLRFNFGDFGGHTRMFCSAGGYFNINKGGQYKGVEYTEYTSSVQKMNVKMDGVLNKISYSARLSVGIGGRVCDFSIYGIYDLTPVYDILGIDKVVTYEITKYTTGDKTQHQNFYEYDSIRKQVKNKFRIGCSLKFYLFSGAYR